MVCSRSGLSVVLICPVPLRGQVRSRRVRSSSLMTSAVPGPPLTWALAIVSEVWHQEGLGINGYNIARSHVVFESHHPAELLRPRVIGDRSGQDDVAEVHLWEGNITSGQGRERREEATRTDFVGISSAPCPNMEIRASDWRSGTQKF